MQSVFITTDVVSLNLGQGEGVVVTVIVWWLDLQLHVPMISVPITTYVVSSNLDQGEVYNIVTKFASGWRQVGSFLRVLRFPPPIQLKYC